MKKVLDFLLTIVIPITLTILFVILIVLIVLTLVVPDQIRFETQDISSLGALIVSILALLQSIIAQKEANEAQAMAKAHEEKRENIEDSCDVIIGNYFKASDTEPEYKIPNRSQFKYDPDTSYLYLNLKNDSDSVLKAIDIFFGEHHFYTPYTLGRNREKNSKIFLPKNLVLYENNSPKRFFIVFTSSNNVKSYGSFTIIDKGSVQKRIATYEFYGTENYGNIELPQSPLT